jgi:chromate reductase
VVELREAILSADAVLIATPEYNHSIPGQLKNALDWVSRPAGQSALSGMPAAAIGASTSMFGGVWAQAELRKVLSAMGGRVVDMELGVPHAQEHLSQAPAGEPSRLHLDPGQEERLDEILAELVAAAERESGLVAA